MEPDEGQRVTPQLFHDVIQGIALLDQLEKPLLAARGDDRHAPCAAGTICSDSSSSAPHGDLHYLAATSVQPKAPLEGRHGQRLGGIIRPASSIYEFMHCHASSAGRVPCKRGCMSQPLNGASVHLLQSALVPQKRASQLLSAQQWALGSGLYLMHCSPASESRCTHSSSS